MFSFIDYVYEIYTVSRERHADIGVAYDMLRADIRTGRRANTEGIELPGFDLAAAHGAFAALTEDEQGAAYAEWADFKRRCYAAVAAAFPDRDKVSAVTAAYRAGEFDKPEPEEESAE